MNKIKQWVLGLEFVKEELNFRYFKGLDDAESSQAEINIDDLVTERISALLGTVDERKIVKIDSAKGIVYLGDTMVDAAMRHNLQQEAELMSKLDLWHLMTNTLESSAQKRIFVDSKDINDILAGKMALYNVSLMKKILTVFLSK